MSKEALTGQHYTVNLRGWRVGRLEFVVEGCQRNTASSDTFLTTIDPTINIYSGAQSVVVQRAGDRAGSVGVLISL